MLSNPSVAVALMAPDGRRQLEHDLSMLDDWRAMGPEEEMEMTRFHGDRVYRNAGFFP